MSIISSVSYLLINWLDDYSKRAAVHLPFTSPGTLEWAAVNASQVLCVSQDKYSMVIHVPWGQRVSSLASERGFHLPFAINSRKPKHHELEHRALPGRRRSPK